MKRALKFLIKKVIYAGIASILFLGIAIGYIAFTWHMPSVADLKNYNPPTITRFYASDGNIFAEFAKEKRIFVPYEKIPPIIVHTFLTVEDKTSFITRASIILVLCVPFLKILEIFLVAIRFEWAGLQSHNKSQKISSYHTHKLLPEK